MRLLVNRKRKATSDLLHERVDRLMRANKQLNPKGM